MKLAHLTLASAFTFGLALGTPSALPGADPPDRAATEPLHSPAVAAPPVHPLVPLDPGTAKRRPELSRAEFSKIPLQPLPNPPSPATGPTRGRSVLPAARTTPDCAPVEALHQALARVELAPDPGSREPALLELAARYVALHDWSSARDIYRHLLDVSTAPPIRIAAERNLEVATRQLAILDEPDPDRRDQRQRDLADLHFALGHQQAGERLLKELALHGHTPARREEATARLREFGKHPGPPPAPPPLASASRGATALTPIRAPGAVVQTSVTGAGVQASVTGAGVQTSVSDVVVQASSLRTSSSLPPGKPSPPRPPPLSHALTGVPTPSLLAPTLQPVSVRQEYSPDGQLLRRVTGNGDVITYGYDDLGRLISLDYPGGTSPDATFTYDANGNLVRMDDWTGTTAYAYDVFDRLTGIDYPGGGFVRYGYDPVGNVTDLRFGQADALDEPGGYNHVRYTYDADNRLLSVTDVLAEQTTRYEYNAAGQPATRTLPNGVLTRYGYDEGGRLISVEHTRANDQLIVRYTYSLNAVGQRLRAVETTPDEIRTTTYTYDVMDRLDTVTYPDGRFVDYDYDAVGNRLRMLERIGNQTKVRTYLYDADSRLLATTLDGESEESLRYDATGNLIQRIRAADGQVINYVYDAENRLVRYADGTHTAEYIYNAAGLRVAKLVDHERVEFLNDPNRDYSEVLAERTGEFGVTRTYVRGSELIRQEEVGSHSDLHPLHDAPAGSFRMVLSEDGGVLEQYDFDAFGWLTSSYPARALAYGFHGERHETESGLLFLRARYYNPALGRFLNRDPASPSEWSPQELNPYAFAFNDPVNHRDPSGTVAFLPAVVGGLLGGVAGGVAYHFLAPQEVRDRYGSKGYATAIASGALLGAVAPYAVKAAATSPAVIAASAWMGSAWHRVTAFAEKASRFRFSLDLPRSGHYHNFRNVPAPNQWYFGHSRASELHFQINTRLAGVKGSDFKYYFPLSQVQAVAAQVVKRTAPFLTASLGYADRAEARPGGITLNQTATVLGGELPLTGAAYDPATGSLFLLGTTGSSSVLRPTLDDLAVAARAVAQGAYPVVSIEEPMFEGTPEWGRQAVFTVRYGPYFTDPADGQSKVLDLASKTRFGWVMFEADRLMKCLSLGADNRDSSRRLSSGVPGYRNLLDLGWQYRDVLPDQVTTRFWFNPKEIVIAPSADGRSMELRRAVMQLSTETMFASNGQVESTPDAEYFARWFTDNYDAIAREQVTSDDDGQPHRVFQELQQLAALVGILKWVQENNIPLDLSFLENYQPRFFASAPDYTPVIKATFKHTTPAWERTITLIGGVNYCHDLDFGPGGNPSALATAALAARAADTNLTWQFQQNGTPYQAGAVSIARQEKDGSLAVSVVDAAFQVPGGTPLQLARHFDSFNLRPGPFGWGWQPQPYALEFLAPPSRFNLCGQEWEGYSEVYFVDRAAQAYYRFGPAGQYDRQQDPLGLASRFAAGADILVYDFQSKEVPGLLFSDNRTGLTLRLAGGALLDFSLRGDLRQIEDLNGNRIRYEYDTAGRLARIAGSPDRAIQFTYDVRTGRISQARLPDDTVVNYTYDATGHLTTVHQRPPNGFRVAYAYTPDHQLTEILDETGQSAGRAAYDVYGRVSQTQTAGNATPFRQQFSLPQRTTQITGPEGFTRGITYDARYHPTQVTDAAGRQTAIDYNPLEEVTRTRRPDGSQIEYFYDARGQPVATLHPNGRADLTFFNSRGQPTLFFHAEADAAFRQSFDAQHRLTRFQGDAYVAGYTEFDYDARGNLTAVTDANGQTRAFAYDPRGQLTSTTDARGQRTLLQYDAAGRLVRLTDPLGRWIEYTYDARDHLTAIRTVHGRIDQSWNVRDQLTTVTTGDPDQRRTTTYRYDARGQLTEVVSPDGTLTQYTYDPRGNLLRIVHDGREHLRYEYDGLDRLTITRYAGTAGGEVRSLIPLPTPADGLPAGPLELRWLTRGPWDPQARVRLQYALDGGAWTDAATLDPAAGRFSYDPAGLTGDSLQLRYLLPSGAGEALPVLGPTLSLRAGTDYYVNDAVLTGDVYCRQPGRPFQAGSATGRSPDDPLDSLTALLDHYDLEPGDRVWIDTGSYPLTADLWIGPEHSGTPDNPVRISGPAAGGRAVFTHAQPAASFAVFVLADTSCLTLEHLTLSRGSAGLLLWNATNCVARALQCTANGVPGDPGELGFAAGIWIRGGRGHLLEDNQCHANEAVGGDGNQSNMRGGDGTAYGILVESAAEITLRANHCFDNTAQAGRAGSPAARPGFAEAAGILVRSTPTEPPPQDLRLLDNFCYQNLALGRDATRPGPAVAPGGHASVFGIGIHDTARCLLTANRTDENVAWGGRSWNGSTGSQGGNGLAYGLYVANSTEVEISTHRASRNLGQGEYGGNGPADRIGLGWAAGVYLENSPGTLIRNTLADRNQGVTYASFGQEPGGRAYASGLELEASPHCRLLGNTVADNATRLEANAATGQSLTLTAQIYLWGSSSNTTLSNNLLDAPDSDTTALTLEPDSQPGLASDYNLFHLRRDAAAGVWNSRVISTLEAWQTNSRQDAHSLAADPLYHDPTSPDYHLSDRSPALDAGTDLPDLPTDADLERRPAPGLRPDAPARSDIGFDEFVDRDGDRLADRVETLETHTDPARPDTDGDGLPDGWEVAHRLDPLDPAGIHGPDGDPDGDGYTNREEHLHQTNPRDPADKPNTAPRLAHHAPSSERLLLFEGDSLEFVAAAEDRDGDPIAYAWELDGQRVATTPRWLFTTDDASSGPDSLARAYEVRLTLSDPTHTASRTWTVEVRNRNRPPVLEPLPDLAATVGDTVRIAPVFHDPDNRNAAPGDDNQLAVVVSGWMTNLTRITTEADRGTHTVQVTVRDDGDPPLSATRTFRVSVGLAGLRIAGLRRLATGAVELHLEGTHTGRWLALESVDLEHWTEVPHEQLAGDRLLLHPRAGPPSIRFFRLVLNP